MGKCKTVQVASTFIKPGCQFSMERGGKRDRHTQREIIILVEKIIRKQQKCSFLWCVSTDVGRKTGPCLATPMLNFITDLKL